MRVELLFWAGCPSHPQALRDLRAALAGVGLDPESVTVREISTDVDAAHERFIGSPTIRIEGEDVQPEPREPVGLTCRVYRRRDGRISPTPDPDDVLDALRRALADAGAGGGAHARAGAGAAAAGGDSGADAPHATPTSTQPAGPR
jgi:hypothetical protein